MIRERCKHCDMEKDWFDHNLENDLYVHCSRHWMDGRHEWEEAKPSHDNIVWDENDLKPMQVEQNQDGVWELVQ